MCTPLVWTHRTLSLPFSPSLPVLTYSPYIHVVLYDGFVPGSGAGQVGRCPEYYSRHCRRQRRRGADLHPQLYCECLPARLEEAWTEGRCASLLPLGTKLSSTFIRRTTPPHSRPLVIRVTRSPAGLTLDCELNCTATKVLPLNMRRSMPVSATDTDDFPTFSVAVNDVGVPLMILCFRI